MQKITRRPEGTKRRTSRSRRKTRAQVNRQDKLRNKRHQVLEQRRKLKRKLCYLVEKISTGYGLGVRNSPLIRANIPIVTRMLRNVR